MRKFATRIAVVAIVGAGAAVGLTVVPAQAAQAQPCSADGLKMYGRYPIEHDQRIYHCAPDPFTPRWVFSETCPAGTRPATTLALYYPHSNTGPYLATTTCASA
ncbi:hypothetical protein ABNF97_26350 [Plantactinospora sp. B6F1]|uniref:hypothetical protein n=1 Tax=Plantactinospora sp. B6F1 TaxID=3158971 RepID=UPI00102B1BF4